MPKNNKSRNGHAAAVDKRVIKGAEVNGKAAAVRQRKSPPVKPEPLPLKEMAAGEPSQRNSIVLWRRPFTTIHYFLFELVLSLKEYTIRLWGRKGLLASVALLAAALALAYGWPGPHQQLMARLEQRALWCLYWLGLGVLSSVGLGTGLHTFLLYLGPHIAAVTLAAYECASLDFPEPPYPDNIVCPEERSAGAVPVTVWSIMSKVRLEAMMWGAGTALGELPPYFVARAARLSANSKRRSSLDRLENADDSPAEVLAELEALKRKQNQAQTMSYVDRAKLAVERLVERAGFFGILACASIPNPLFDLAGITCGHFLVPFWTFFGATLIGKAVIKTHLQQLTVIVAFNENLVQTLVSFLANVPVLGPRLQQLLQQLLKSQKAKLHSRSAGGDSSLIGSLFNLLVTLMLAYFLVSIVNSLAQSYHDRLQQRAARPSHKTARKKAVGTFKKA